MYLAAVVDNDDDDDNELNVIGIRSSACPEAVDDGDGLMLLMLMAASVCLVFPNITSMQGTCSRLDISLYKLTEIKTPRQFYLLTYLLIVTDRTATQHDCLLV